MYAIRLTHGASTVEVKISPSESYVTNLCTILTSLQILTLEEPPDSEQQQQLAFKYSLQHVEKNSQNFYLEASDNGPNGYPLGNQTRIYLRNNHFQYALTWFFIAIGLISVFISANLKKK